MKDLLSRQEKESLEQCEMVGPIGIYKDPIPPIVVRLIDRKLLKHHPRSDDNNWDHVEITERGLTALRGGKWDAENSAPEVG